MKRGVVPVICALVVVLVIALAITSFAFLKNTSSEFTLDIATEDNFVINLGDITSFKVDGEFNALASNVDNSGSWTAEFGDKEGHQVVTITVPCSLSVDPLLGYQSTISVSGISIVDKAGVLQEDLIGYMRNAFEYKVVATDDCVDVDGNSFVTNSEWSAVGSGGAVIKDNKIPRKEGEPTTFTVTISLRLILADDLVPYDMVKKGLSTQVRISVGLEPETTPQTE